MKDFILVNLLFVIVLLLNGFFHADDLTTLLLKIWGVVSIVILPIVILPENEPSETPQGTYQIKAS